MQTNTPRKAPSIMGRILRSFATISKLAGAFMLFSVLAFGQASVAISPVAKQQFLDASGRPLVGGKLYTYQAGTTTPQATYVDATGTAVNTNPIILDAGGYTPQALFLVNNQQYKFVLYS